MLFGLAWLDESVLDEGDGTNVLSFYWDDLWKDFNDTVINYFFSEI